MQLWGAPSSMTVMRDTRGAKGSEVSYENGMKEGRHEERGKKRGNERSAGNKRTVKTHGSRGRKEMRERIKRSGGIHLKEIDESKMHEEEGWAVREAEGIKNREGSQRNKGHVTESGREKQGTFVRRTNTRNQ